MHKSSQQGQHAWLPVEQAELLITSLCRAQAPAGSATPCGALSAEDLAHYVSGTADADAALRVTTHLCLCDTCRGVVSRALDTQQADAHDTVTHTLARGQLDSLFTSLNQRPQAPERVAADDTLPRKRKERDSER